MGFLDNLYDLFTTDQSYTSKPVIDSNSILAGVIPMENTDDSSNSEDFVSVTHRSVMNKLYILEQEIAVFEKDYSDQFRMFMQEIEDIRSSYTSDIEKVKQKLTFEIDPDLNSNYTGRTIKLEKEIKRFIETEVKFDTISKRLQELIVKLNILYNISIFHKSPKEKGKISSRISLAVETVTRITREFKDSEYVLSDAHLSERLINLISYIDYEIFKLKLCTSDLEPAKIIDDFIMVREFRSFDYVSSLKAFLKDEISDLGELLSLVVDSDYQKVFKNQYDKLLSDILLFDTDTSKIFDRDFWNSYLEFEIALLQFLRSSGVSPDKAKVRLIVRMEINVNENDIAVLPITIANISLYTLYLKTLDIRILLLLKLFRNLSRKVTYKEIYFLIVLFDSVDLLQKYPNDLLKHIEKYIKELSYNYESFRKKKQKVLKSKPCNDYVKAFQISDSETDCILELDKLLIDYKIQDDYVYINEYYFKGLKNILSSFTSQ